MDRPGCNPQRVTVVKADSRRISFEERDFYINLAHSRCWVERGRLTLKCYNPVHPSHTFDFEFTPIDALDTYPIA